MPSDMMLCVISYWVLSGAKRRQIQQLRCCAFPAKLLKRRDVYLKLTRHNGRAGAHGTYNPKHNDRSFNLANSEHIDPERAKGNIYWDCFHGFRSALDPQDSDDLAATFSDVERQFYESRYSNFVESQNERNAKIRHTERNRSIREPLSSHPGLPERPEMGWNRADSSRPAPLSRCCGGWVHLRSHENLPAGSHQAGVPAGMQI